MKVSTGSYFNLFSEQGYDNYELKVKFDIMIIFIESFELTVDLSETLELFLEKELKNLGKSNPYTGKDLVLSTVLKVLDSLGYEYERVLIDQHIS